MTLTAISAQEFFANANKIAATKVSNARFVRSGETAVINMGFAVEARVDDDSWYVPMSGGGQLFDKEELLEHVVDPKSVLRFELPQDAKVKSIEKGGTYVANVGGLRFETSAPTDGNLVKFSPDADWKFIPVLLYQAVYGDQQPIEGHMLVALDDPIQCVVLTEPVTFAFLGGEYNAEVGMILYENSEDQDGYTVVSAMYFLDDHVLLR